MSAEESRSTRLLTSFGTVVYVDPGTGELRHGPVATSPGNALFVADPDAPDGPREGWLVYETGETREPIACAAERSMPASHPAEGPTRLTLVQLERGLVGLRADERYLCAEAAGRITLSRDHCSAWEAFLPTEAWCTAPLSPPEERKQAALAATIAWKSFAAISIDPDLVAHARDLTKPKRLKIAVYTIALNEAAHAERWARSAAEADYRVVADTGSTDDTVAILEREGVTVHHIALRPWRFDDARNTAMALLPADVDVCCTMDMDMFLEPGWRPRLEAAWTPDTTALNSRLVWLASADDPTPLRYYPAKNFHARWGYRFKRPVHEHLVYAGDEVKKDSDIVINHIRSSGGDNTRYMPLLEQAIAEDPEDGQVYFWLARDCMWANRHERGIELLLRYLALPSSTWPVERSEAMRLLARMQPEQKMSWLDKARLEAPYRREVWLDLAEEFHQQEDWLDLLWACTSGLERTRRTNSYLDEENSWGPRLFDLGAIACWRLNVRDKAVEWGREALALDPGNERLQGELDSYVHRRDEVHVAA